MKHAIVLLALAGCGGDLLANEGFSILCNEDDTACEWSVVEGEAVFGPSWHTGDPGLDLSGPGRIVVEQRAAPVAIPTREMILEAAIARSAEATVRFEIDWFIAGPEMPGRSYWEREPRLVATRTFTVARSGIHAYETALTTPTPEVSGLAVRIVKEGTGQVVVDQVTLREPREEVQ